jgi:hypothetical protein
MPLLGDLLPPGRDRPFHNPHPGGEEELLDEFAGPLAALVAGVVPFGFHAAADLADLAKSVDIFGRVRLHAAGAFRFFRLGPVKIAHHRLEFLVAVADGDVNPASPAVKPAGRHQIPISELFLGPSFHTVLPPFSSRINQSGSHR